MALGLSAAVACGYMVMGIITRTAVVESYTYALMSGYELDNGVVGTVHQPLAAFTERSRLEQSRHTYIE